MRQHGRTAQSGFTLVELLTAVAILLIGIVAVAQMVPAALTSNLRNRVDSTALIVAQRELEQMAAQPLNVQAIAGLGHYNFQDSDGALAYLGPTIPALVTRAGCPVFDARSTPAQPPDIRIDFRQPANLCGPGYQRYVNWVWNQATGDTQTIDLRWHVIVYNQGAFPARKLIIIAGRAVGAAAPPGLPANLYTVVGRSGG